MGVAPERVREAHAADGAVGLELPPQVRRAHRVGQVADRQLRLAGAVRRQDDLWGHLERLVHRPALRVPVGALVQAAVPAEPTEGLLPSAGRRVGALGGGGGSRGHKADASRVRRRVSVERQTVKCSFAEGPGPGRMAANGRRGRRRRGWGGGLGRRGIHGGGEGGAPAGGRQVKEREGRGFDESGRGLRGALGRRGLRLAVMRRRNALRSARRRIGIGPQCLGTSRWSGFR
mmetsp:Transcript_24738/g.42427  ORF Transcript_24738/g.42427 Transcript_24738/m.42427 type:complete len:232 (-) Transcript_24738:113-808(-)